MHPHAAGPGLTQLLTAGAVLPAATAYLTAAARLRRRGDAWPRARDVSCAAGATALVTAVMLPLPGGPFTAHMAQHLIVAMAAPLLLVLARPLTLTLRALPPGRIRRGLVTVAHARPARWLVFPPLAGLLDIGGLWLLYRTPLLAASHHQPVVSAAVHVHLVAAGLLFGFTVCRLDPLRHRWRLAWRGATLLAAGAAHAVLAKTLYATPPPGTAFATADLHAGAQLMYYGGDLAEVALAAVLAAQWYATTGRAQARLLRRTAATTAGAPGTTAVGAALPPDMNTR